MRSVLVGLILTYGTTFPALGSTFGVDGLSFRAGVGYEFLSQDFYLDSLDQAGADSLEITTSLKTTYFDDLKAQLRFGYTTGTARRFSIDGIYEQTAEQQRLRAYLYHSLAAGPFRIDWSGEGDFREGEVDPAQGDPGYLYGNGRIRVTLPIGRKTHLWTRGRGDWVNFDSAASGAFNYNRVGIELGLTQYIGDFSMLTGSGFGLDRNVSDVPTEEYRSRGGDLILTGVLAGGDYDLSMRYESRDYARGGARDDYRRWELNVRDYRPIGTRFFTREEGELEVLTFDSTTYLSSDYRRLEVSVLGGINWRSMFLAAGPHVALLAGSRSDAYTVSEDYIEYGIKAQVDLIQPGRALVSVESITGTRDLEDEGTAEQVQTDFAFERLNLLVDWTLAGRVGLNLLLSTEWEWHRVDSENSRLALISTGLSYSF